MEKSYDFTRELGPIKTSDDKGWRMFTTIPADVMKSKALAKGDMIEIQFNDKEGNRVVVARATIISERRISYNKEATEELVKIFGLSPKKPFGFVVIEKGKWMAREL